ncbi:hypothetical protein Tco_1360996 [Tanacetum coccineum]
MPNNVKTYDGTGGPEDYVKNFQAAAQVERWPMPTWCHMFNSTLIGAARQQKKYVKDPIEIHNIKQKDKETIEEFMERFKVETECMKEAPEPWSNDDHAPLPFIWGNAVASWQQERPHTHRGDTRPDKAARSRAMSDLRVSNQDRRGV